MHKGGQAAKRRNAKQRKTEHTVTTVELRDCVYNRGFEEKTTPPHLIRKFKVSF
jgi:hypothetical protein